MGTTAIDPQSIRNVTIIGDPADTTRIVRRLLRGVAGTRSGTAAALHWVTSRVDHTIRFAEFSSHAPIAALERAIRLADGVIAVLNAAVQRAPRLETILRMADDHQVARMCLVTGLDDPAADFEGRVRAIEGTRGATPLILHLPLGVGAAFEGVIDLIPMWTLEPMAAEFYGSHWEVAERRYRDLAAAVTEAPDELPYPPTLPPQRLYDGIRRATRIGDAIPILCDPTPRSDDMAPLLDAIVRYLPSPMLVCQPEHALDY
ncbi:hypothetical protein [Nocardia arizonensis]|uniref:hypothetical protein n=1 Tax=Nocardia arizonensis TaxID=1141647 RepID=UPI0006D1EE58|nr:hypothetical protein [Nocardia arizonensis]